MAWVKGQSGNPNGRPRKKRALSALLRTVGGTKTDDGKVKKRLLAEKIWELALTGDLVAARIIYEYCDGKPTEKLVHEIPDGKQAVIAVIEVVRPDGA